MAQSSGAKTWRLKMIAVVVWLITTLSLAGWWLVFGLMQVDRIGQIVQSETRQEIERTHRMLLSEGAVLFVLLLCGGIALIYFLSVEISRTRQIREFFAAFTHDLKTSLASLRLQAETLEEGLKNLPQHERVMKRLVKDTIRLELQLDNSLFIADPQMGQLHIEKVHVQEVVRSLSHYWPEMKIEIDHDCLVRADRRALESIFKNLLQNAVVHGKASQVQVRCESMDGGATVALEIADNGKGFAGDASQLGQMFVRHTSTSGSGIGLYLARTLAERMDGKLEFIPGDMTNPQGFRSRLLMPGDQR